MQEITKQDIKEIINELKENLTQLDHFLDYGATLGETQNNTNDIINNYNYLMKRLKDYQTQEAIKELKRLESEIY